MTRSPLLRNRKSGGSIEDRIPARSSLSGVESLELLSSWWEELLALLMSILGVLGVLSELPGVAGVVTSTMPGIRAAGSPCIQIRKAGLVVESQSLGCGG